MCSPPFISVVKWHLCMRSWFLVGRVSCFVLDRPPYPKVWESNDSHVPSLFPLGAMCCVCAFTSFPRLKVTSVLLAWVNQTWTALFVTHEVTCYFHPCWKWFITFNAFVLLKWFQISIFLLSWICVFNVPLVYILQRAFLLKHQSIFFFYDCINLC